MLKFKNNHRACSQRLYRVIGYADSEHNIVNNILLIFVVVYD